MSYYRLTLALTGLVMFVGWQWPQQAAAQVNVDVGNVHVHVGAKPPPAPAESVEVLTRGPIHEAFAQPVALDEDTPLTVATKPPAPIEEIPPDQRPAGDDVVWIPGYWSWDTDREDFIWVSGCWRAAPPNSSWVPGYWATVKDGYQWVNGFWTTADVEELDYLPEPPASLENGPQGQPASDDSVWIPGCWVRHDARFLWRPGFWAKARTNWVWEPAHYVCSPRGCVYVEGYWDYPLERRGVAFLPMYAPARVYGVRDFRYTPTYVLALDTLTLNLFISPRMHHYYFGDYYDARFVKAGFHPWYEARDHYGWYDPIYVHQRWVHRDDRKWADNQRAAYELRRDDKNLRPARTYEAMRTQVSRMPEKDRRDAMLARPMKDVVSDKGTTYKFDKVDAKAREAAVVRARDVHDYGDKRAKWETPVTKDTVIPKETPRDHGAVVPADKDIQKVKIPKSPVIYRESSRDKTRDKDLTPPDAPKQPDLDPKAKPKSGRDSSDHGHDRN